METKVFETYSDAGGVAVGTEECRCIVSNGYGDGMTVVYAGDEEDVWKAVSKDGYEKEGFRFATSFEGPRIEIPDYDCPSMRPWFDGDVHDWTPVVVLSGRFMVYQGKGAVLFCRIGDFRPVTAEQAAEREEQR